MPLLCRVFAAHLPGTCTLGEIDRTGRSSAKGAKVKRDRITKRRGKLARMAERAAIPERPIRGSYLIRPAVSVACAPSLQAIAAALRDATQHIDEQSLEAAWRFFTDGATALYGYDVTEALRETVRLQQKIVQPEPVELDQAPRVLQPLVHMAVTASSDGGLR